MSIKEGFESEEPDVIKRGRGVAKGNVTKNAKKLIALLKKDTEEKFVYDDIDMTDVVEVVDKLNGALEDTWNLHSRLLQFREVSEDATEKDKLEEEQKVLIQRCACTDRTRRKSK